MARLVPPKIIKGETMLRIVDSTKGWRELKKFRCGWSDKKAETEIHDTAQALARGEVTGLGAGISGPVYQRIIALESESGTVISWCGITRRHLCELPMPTDPGLYIFAIGTSWEYRGWRLDVGGTRPSDAVIRYALEVGAEDLGNGTMPYAWARVLPGNVHSNRLFDDHCFDLYTRPEEQMIRARCAGLNPAACRWNIGGEYSLGA